MSLCHLDKVIWYVVPINMMKTSALFFLDSHTLKNESMDYCNIHVVILQRERKIKVFRNTVKRV